MTDIVERLVALANSLGGDDEETIIGAVAEIKRLRRITYTGSEKLESYADHLEQEIERLREEGTVEVARLLMRVNSQELELRSLHTVCAELQELLADWRSRYDAERADHEATIAHCDRLMRDSDPGIP